MKPVRSTTTLRLLGKPNARGKHEYKACVVTTVDVVRPEQKEKQTQSKFSGT
jgi:hypothetical protein